jgi:hypothetical protein
MTRNRAPINGGYVRKTVSLPAELVDRIEVHLADTPGLTLSAFISVAGEEKITKIERRRQKD